MDKINNDSMENKKRNLIDFNKIYATIKQNKKKYYYTVPTVLVVTYLLTLCVPRYYSCSIVLAPESNDLSSYSSIGSTLSSLGLGSLGKMGNNDAISPELYPDLLSSNDFITKMFPIQVTTKDGKLTTPYYNYLEAHRKDAWWNKVFNFIKNKIKPQPKSNYHGDGPVDVFSMSKTQQDIAGLISKNINCDIDQKTYAIKITVNDQDPRVCATIADSTCSHLQRFIIDYRTSKARNDYKYYAKLCDEAKAQYDKARRKYADFSDSNTDIQLKSVQSLIDDMENEMQLRYNIYSAMNSQKQSAMAKIQENTPAFTILQSATMPIKPAGPKRMIISLAMAILAFVGLTMYLLRRSIC